MEDGGGRWRETGYGRRERDPTVTDAQVGVTHPAGRLREWDVPGGEA